METVKITFENEDGSKKAIINLSLDIEAEQLKQKTHKLCKKCNQEYNLHGNSLTKCPNCPKLIIENEKDNNTLHRPSTLSKKPKIERQRVRNKLYKLSNSGSELGKTKASIPKVSKKQAQINREYAKVKEQIAHDRNPWCESCGSPNNLEPSHAIPRSIRKDLELDPEGIFIQCHKCHYCWEHQMLDCLKFKNLEKMLAYVKSKDLGRYIFIMNKLKMQVEYSR